MTVVFTRWVVTALALIPVSIGAGSVDWGGAQSTSTSAALTVAERFHEYLGHGDSASAAGLLAADATILESGDRETRTQYVAHHLGEDIAFAKAVPSTRTVVDVKRQGDAVWVVATSVTKGSFEGRKIDSRGAELIVLSRSGSRWLIRAIHWSSRRSGS